MNSDKGRAAARYFGSECQANPGSTFYEYKDDIADHYGYERWEDMPRDLQTEAKAAFREGREAERSLQ